MGSLHINACIVEPWKAVTNGQLVNRHTCSCDLGVCAGLACLLWIISRVRPDLRVTELRITTYHDMYTRFLVASTRAARTNPMKHQALLADFSSKAGPLEDEAVFSLAKGEGFNENCLQSTNKIKTPTTCRRFRSKRSCWVPHVSWVRHVSCCRSFCSRWIFSTSTRSTLPYL